MELLLQRGAKGDQSDVNNKKASDLAASLGHQDVLSLLAGEKLSEHCSYGQDVYSGIP